MAPRAGRGATYGWQYEAPSAAWVDLPRTNTASTVVADLTPGTVYSLRYHTLFRNVLSDWSDPVAFRVL